MGNNLVLATYSKSNTMVSAKYKSNLLENKLYAVALTRIERNKDRTLEAKMYPGELARMVSDKNHISRDLKKVAPRMVKHVMVLEDDKGNFEAFAIVTNAVYEDGIFTLKFNSALEKHILELEGNFTKLNYALTMSFESVNAFRLYELFKSEYYKADDNGELILEYNLAELKFTIGIANSDNEGHLNRLSNMTGDIDWDELLDKLDKKDKKYNNSNDFKRWVLDPAKQELDEKADISFTYRDGVKKGNKLITIVFVIYKNTPKYDFTDNSKLLYDNEKNSEHQNTMPRDLPQYTYVYETYVGHNNLMAEDIDLLIIKANMDDKLVVRAIEAADNQEYLRNYMGWIIKYIEAGGYEEIETLSGDSQMAQTIRLIQEDHKNNINATAQRVWDKTKTKDDINNFLESLDFSSIEDFELIYDDPKESYEMYIEWKKNNK